MLQSGAGYNEGCLDEEWSQL